METSKQLTHSTIQAAQPAAKPRKLTDTDRLYVLITVSGKKYWKWNYRLDGKDNTYAIGTFPDIKPAEARQRRMEAEKLVAQGIHPAAHEAECWHRSNASAPAVSRNRPFRWQLRSGCCRSHCWQVDLKQ